MGNEISYESTFNVLQDSPARWDDYESVTKSSKFPLLFFAVRWIEDLAVADRPIELCPKIEVCPTFIPETLIYWVGVQWGLSYLMGRRCLFSLGWPPF